LSSWRNGFGSVVESTFDTGEPQVSYIPAFGQEFSQVPVPEPGTFGLLLAGVAGTLYRDQMFVRVNP